MTPAETFTGLRERLRSRTPTTAAFLDLGSPVTAEIASKSGFDAVVVDLEHGAGDEAAARTQIAMAQQGAFVIIRTPEGGGQISRMLDFGASGVLIPRVKTTTQANTLAAATRYAGSRGVSPLARSTGFGVEATGSWRPKSDARIACIIQIETADALSAVGEIAALEEVDALLVGPADLANDLGCDPDLDTEPLHGAALQAINAAKRNNKTAGIHLGGGQDADPWIRAGATLLSLSFESALLAAASLEVAERIRSSFARAGP